MIAVLAAFFDDSGTHADSKFLVLGGLLGTFEQWEVFDKAWSTLLANPFPGKAPIKNFHLSHCQARRGEFKDYTVVETEDLTYRFRQIILDTGLVTFAVCVNLDDWRELVAGDLADLLGGPEGLCFVKCIEIVINTIRLRKPGQPLSLFFDQGIRHKLGQWADLYINQTETFPEIESISFASVSRVPPLQGADMIATETYRYNHEWANNQDAPKVNSNFKVFLESELSVGLIFERSIIQEMVEAAKLKMSSLSENDSTEQPF
jgi:hypothetical protein